MKPFRFAIGLILLAANPFPFRPACSKFLAVLEAETMRAVLDARQADLRSARLGQALAWLGELELTGDPVLFERAVKSLGFREREWSGDQLLVVDDGELVPVKLEPRAVARLVRARADAGWSFQDVRPLVRSGASEVPSRYEALGTVVAIVGALPEIRIDVAVPPGATIAFEVGLSYREWIVEGSVGYVGKPPPAIGARVWRVSPA